MRKVPTIPDDRNRHAETWQRLADIRVSVPGWGNITVADLLQQVSASDAETCNALSRECDNLAAVLAPLPASERDEIIERIADAVREKYEAQADDTGVRQ